MNNKIFTIGHSTRTWDEFVELLHAHEVGQLADVRSYPGSRRHPHFARQHFESALPETGVAYRWMPNLGGRRKSALKSSPNQAWRVEGFRFYADYMASPEFAEALQELEAWAALQATVYMCAEAFFVRCHRQLISDALVARGWQVLHITSKSQPKAHVMTPFASVDASAQVTYPGNPTLALEEE